MEYMENPWNTPMGRIYGKPMEHTYGKMMVLVLNPLAATGIPCVFHVFPQVSHMLPVN